MVILVWLYLPGASQRLDLDGRPPRALFLSSAERATLAEQQQQQQPQQQPSQSPEQQSPEVSPRPPSPEPDTKRETEGSYVERVLGRVMPDLFGSM